MALLGLRSAQEEEEQEEEEFEEGVEVGMTEAADIEVKSPGGEVGCSEDVATGADSEDGLMVDELEASELQTDVAPAMVLSHEPPTMEKRPNRVTLQLDWDFCCARTCCAMA